MLKCAARERAWFDSGRVFILSIAARSAYELTIPDLEKALLNRLNPYLACLLRFSSQRFQRSFAQVCMPSHNCLPSLIRYRYTCCMRYTPWPTSAEKRLAAA